LFPAGYPLPGKEPPAQSTKRNKLIESKALLLSLKPDHLTTTKLSTHPTISHSRAKAIGIIEALQEEPVSLPHSFKA
jgi:hypothetical protein